jgi:hypothetical protein
VLAAESNHCGAVGAYSKRRKDLGLAHNGNRAPLAVNLDFLALGHGTIGAICVDHWACHIALFTKIAKLRELARLVGGVWWNLAAPEILRSGDEIRLDLTPVGDRHRGLFVPSPT